VKDSDQLRSVPASMRSDLAPNRFGYSVIAAGTVLSIISAIVPFYTAGYQLQFAVLMAGITPYLVYGLVVHWLRRPMTIVAGALLFAAHLGLVAFASDLSRVPTIQTLRSMSCRWLLPPCLFRCWSWPCVNPGVSRSW
jgi:hypothetical protein